MDRAERDQLAACILQAQDTHTEIDKITRALRPQLTPAGAALSHSLGSVSVQVAD